MSGLDHRALPKALLHDHLDGGLRAATVLELADEHGYDLLPVSDPDGLADWFHQDRAGSLEAYLAAFRHTVAVMQTAPALTRVGYEAVIDLAAAGVVYAELRFGPMLHLQRGMTPPEVVAAVAEGVRQGESEAGTVARLILTALREATDSAAVAELAAASRELGVVGFDLAGPEAGYPPDRHLAACRVARGAGLGLTIHAGEGAGPDSVAAALGSCGAHRIGHGVRIIEDTLVAQGEITKLGRLAAWVRDRQVPLEVAISSNLDTGLYPDVSSHPAGLLHRAGFVVTLNTDNRLMSATDPAREFRLATEHLGFGPADLQAVTEAALLAGFADWPTRRQLLQERVRPVYGSLS